MKNVENEAVNEEKNEAVNEENNEGVNENIKIESNHFLSNLIIILQRTLKLDNNSKTNTAPDLLKKIIISPNQNLFRD